MHGGDRQHSAFDYNWRHNVADGKKRKLRILDKGQSQRNLT